MIKRILLAGFSLVAAKDILAQKRVDKELHLTTGIGVNKIQGQLGKTFRSTVAFNSGFEKAFAKNWYAQLDINFNSLRYEQQVIDNNSPFLFQNTSSSLFMAGINFGKDFAFSNSKWFTSLYSGTGYLNIGEPRIQIDELNNIASQDVIRKGGVLGKAGGRIGLHTKSSFLQTIYIDGSYWATTLKVQGERFRSLSLFAGIRMSMSNDNKAVKKQMAKLFR